MAWGNRVVTTTQDKLMPKVVDTILNSNVFATRMLGRAKKWTGEFMKFPIKYVKNATGGSFSGFDTFSTNASDTRVNMQFYPKFYHIDVALPLDELSVNATDEKVLDLARIELASSAQDMADDIGTLFNATAFGVNTKNFDGLGDVVDDGGIVTTYGGLARATYPTLDATVTSLAGVGGKLTLDAMATLYNDITSGSQKPTIGLATKAVFSLYEKLLTPQEQIVKDVPMVKKGLIGGTGYTGLFYKGFPILEDEKCTTGYLYFLNEDFLDWYALPVAMTEAIKYKSTDIEGNDYSDVMGLGFSWSGWIKPTNSATIVGHIYLGGNLICTNPKRQGKLTNVTTV